MPMPGSVRVPAWSVDAHTSHRLIASETDGGMALWISLEKTQPKPSALVSQTQRKALFSTGRSLLPSVLFLSFILLRILLLRVGPVMHQSLVLLQHSKLTRRSHSLPALVYNALPSLRSIW